MQNLIWLAPIFAVIALIFAAVKTGIVSKADPGTERIPVPGRDLFCCENARNMLP